MSLTFQYLYQRTSKWFMSHRPLCSSIINSLFYRVFPKMHHSLSSNIYSNKILDGIGESAKCVYIYTIQLLLIIHLQESNIATMCSWYSYIVLSLTPSCSCTFGCCLLRHCIMTVTPAVGCFFGFLEAFSEPGTHIALLKLPCGSLALNPKRNSTTHHVIALG